MQKQVAKKVAKIALRVLLYLFIAICIIALLITIISKKDADGTVTLFGYQMRVVVSPSMEKCDETYDSIKQYDIKDIPTRSMVFIDNVPEDAAEASAWYDDIEIGDVLTFKYVYTRQETITHRVTGKEPIDGGYIITLTGDNKATDSTTLTQVIDTSKTNSTNYVVGKVVGQSYPLGLLISALRSPLGLVFLVILPALIIMILEIIHVVQLLNEDKRKARKTAQQQQADELAELRRQIAALQGAQAPAADTTGAQAPPAEAQDAADASAEAPEDDKQA